MRVLLISIFHPEIVRGGAQQVCYELFQELRQRADIVPVLLASVDQRTPGYYKSGARITGFDGRPGEFLFLSSQYDHWWHRVGDPLLVEAFIEFLREISPDVVHFHHFLTLGIDFVSIARRVLPSCRIVFTFHEFLSICAADGHMLRRYDNSLCTRSSQARCHQCFPERGPEDFLVRRMWFMRHLAQADQFTCPSRFMIKHYLDWGLPADKIAWVANGQRINNGVVAPADERTGPRNRFGFFGQLVDVKGVRILLRAVRLLRGEGFTDLTVEINGDNIAFASAAAREEIESFLAAEAALPAQERIVFFNGSYHVDELRSRMVRVDWCVVPSEWWEIFGLVISEAWAFGKPVICANVGGMAERVSDGIDGLHFQVGDPRALAGVIRRACEESGLWQRLRSALPQPPSRAAMADQYIALYAQPTIQASRAADPGVGQRAAAPARKPRVRRSDRAP